MRKTVISIKEYYADDSATTQLYGTRDYFSKSAYSIANPDDAGKDDEDKTYEGLDWLFSSIENQVI